MKVKFENGKMKTDSLVLTTLAVFLPTLAVGGLALFDGIHIGHDLDTLMGVDSSKSESFGAAVPLVLGSFMGAMTFNYLATKVKYSTLD